jgi:hypothetical protein
MNKFSKNSEISKIYLRGLLFDVYDKHQNPSILLRDIKENSSVDASSINNCFFFSHKSHIVPTKSLSARYSTDEDDSFIYDVICLKVDIDDNVNSYFNMAPNVDVLKAVRPIEKQIKYVKCNLINICRDQFIDTFHREIKLSRLNVRIIGDIGNSVSSLAFYGRDIMSSDLLKDILNVQKNDDILHENLFDMNGISDKICSLHQDRFLIPNSCRLTWDVGTKKPVSINIDKFGNFSLFFSSFDTIKGLIELFAYLKEINVFERDIHSDPLRRSTIQLDT